MPFDYLYQRRFETAPRRGAILQTVTGNLVEDSSAERIEIFNGVNDSLHDRNYNDIVNANYYRDYKDYLVGRRCCKKSNLYSNKLDNYNVLGRQRCCGNNNSKYYKSYSDFLSAKNCCSSLIILEAYKKLKQ